MISIISFTDQGVFYCEQSTPQGNLFEYRDGVIRLQTKIKEGWCAIITMEHGQRKRYVGKKPRLVREEDGELFLMLEKISNKLEFPFREKIPLSQILQAEMFRGFQSKRTH